MAGFQFTERGLQPFGDEPATSTEPLFLDIRTSGEGGDPNQGAAPAPALGGAPLRYDIATIPAAKVAAFVPSKPTKPRDIVKQAKARAKELRAQLRQAERWKKELAQLERLIAAADGKAIAVVRNLDSSRRHG